MFCKNCGKEIADNSKFCPSCGCETKNNAIPVSGRTQAPNNHMILGIITTLLCCMPLGIVSIVYASRVDSYWNAGNHDAAMTFSRKAKNWALWGIIGTGLIYILIFALYGSVLLAVLSEL